MICLVIPNSRETILFLSYALQEMLLATSEVVFSSKNNIASTEFLDLYTYNSAFLIVICGFQAFSDQYFYNVFIIALV